jgi:hypothetical protein
MWRKMFARQWVLITVVVLMALGGLLGWPIYKHFFGNQAWISTQSALTLEPVVSDVSGVDVRSEFVLTGKENLDAQAVQGLLRVAPQAEFTVSQKDSLSVAIRFEKPLKENTVYTFRLPLRKPDASVVNGAEENGGNAEGGNELSWAFQTKNPLRVVETLPKDKAVGVPVNSGIEVTFSRDGIENIDDFFEISPKVSGSFEMHKKTAVFVPKKLDPGTVYTVTVKKGLRSTGSEDTLREDQVFEFETAPTNDTMRNRGGEFLREMYEVSGADRLALDVSGGDVWQYAAAKVSVFRFENQENFVTSLKERDRVPRWAYYTWNRYRADTQKLQKIASFEAPIQKLEWSGYFLFPESLPAGYYLVEADLGGEKPAQTWLQVTDLSAYVSTSDTKTLVWANDVTEKKPVSGVKAEIIDDSTVLGTTGEDGVLAATTPDALKSDASDEKRYLLLTAPTNKKLIVPLSVNKSGYYESMYYRSDDYWSYLYLDRSLYKPTDTVAFWGMARKREGAAKKESLQLTITKDGATVWERDVETSEDGMFHGEVPLKGRDTGWYSLVIRNQENAVLVSDSFTIETYVKPAYTISVQPEKKAVFAGEKVSFRGEVTFFEGSPVPHMRLKYTGETKGEVVTDAQGRFTVAYDAAVRAGGHVYDTNTFQTDSISARPTLAEEGEVSGEAWVQVFPSRLGMRIDSSSIEDGAASVQADVFQIDLDKFNSGQDKGGEGYAGAPAARRTLQVRLTELWWEKQETGQSYDFINKQVVKRYTYIQREKELKTDTVQTGADGKVNYRFSIDPQKFYRVMFIVKDDEGKEVRQSQHVYGRFSSSRSGDYWLSDEKPQERYGLKEYGVGEEVKLVFQKDEESLPEGGEHRYLFYQAQRGIRDYAVGPNSRYSFTFGEKDVPNLSVQGVYFNGRTYVESPAYYASFRKKDRELTIDAELDKETYTPKDTVTLNLATKDKSGKPKPAEVNVSVVDEALFALAPQSVNPLQEVYTSVGNGLRGSYISHRYPLDQSLAEQGGCFVGDTPVLMGNGETKPIKDIRAGDVILTRMNELSERMVKAVVNRTFKHTVSEYLVVNGYLKVTPEHNVYVSGRWMTAGEMRVGDFLLNKDNQWERVFAIEKRTGTFEVYNLEIDQYHTFFANGVYVHNDKGRELFMDRAFFGVTRTDAQGLGRIQFQVPDNLTSWRVTYQGISRDLYVGSGFVNARVKLPFFADMVVSEEYLLEDKPVIQVRAFGEQLSSDQEVEFTFFIPSLGLIEGVTKRGKAFEPVLFELPSLREGEHKITVSAKAAGFEDKLTRSVRVVRSRLSQKERHFSPLGSNTHIEGSENGLTYLVVSDEGRARFYGDLVALASTYGDRLDQKIARVKARMLLREYFQEPESEEGVDAETYQTMEGGARLLPYGDNNLELSAQAAAAGDVLDRSKLRRYFTSVLENPDESRDREIVALYGLAALGDPVLVQANRLLEERNLSVAERLYLGLVLAELGDRERAKGVYAWVMENHGKKADTFARIESKEGDDETLRLTALAAQLSGIIGSEDGNLLFEYLLRNRSKDIDTVLAKLLYLESALPKLSGETVSFHYTLDDKTESVSLGRGETLRLALTSDQIKTLRFENIQGRAGLVTVFERATDTATAPTEADRQLTVDREYSVNDRPTQTFKQGDLVKVTLHYSLPPQAPAGCYQVSDVLPSGLKLITRTWKYGRSDINEKPWYPSSVTGQRISFCATKRNDWPIVYYARVGAVGEYKAEGTMVQSLQDTSSVYVGETQTINISE